jgi:hypothetical protein
MPEYAFDRGSKSKMFDVRRVGIAPQAKKKIEI